MPGLKPHAKDAEDAKGNLFVDLPHLQLESQPEYEKGRHDYCQALFSHHELFKKVNEPKFLTDCLGVLVEHFNLTLRETEKVFALLTLYYSSLSPGHFTDNFLVALLSILKVKRPELYGQLRARQVSLEAFFTNTTLDQIKARSQHIDLEWAKQILRACLMTDIEFEKALAAEKEAKGTHIPLSEAKNYFRMGRTKVIPFLCSHLDRFALKP